jgi:hypothetical protein
VTQGREPLRGVGGWLGYLVLLLIVISPVKMVVETGQALQQVESENPGLRSVAEWVDYTQWSWALVAAAVSLSFAAGYRLWKVHHWDSVKFAIGALWLIGAGTSVADWLITWAILDTAVALTEMIDSDIAAALIGPMLWTAYLLRSKRVANTYREAPVYLTAHVDTGDVRD